MTDAKVGLVAGPVSYLDEDECWQGEIQVKGGYEIAAVVYALSEDEARDKQARVLATLLQSDAVMGEAITMVLYCPQCGQRHIDEPDERTPDWTNPSHRSHLCHDCGCIWRPADVPTNGGSIQTRGKADTWSDERGNAESATPIAPVQDDELHNIAGFLVDQSDEPWPSGSPADRLHYWRDKAIEASRRIERLSRQAGG